MRLLELLLVCAMSTMAQSKAVVTLDAASQMAAWADMVSTEKSIQPQFRHEAGGVIVVTPGMAEGDPLARPLVELPKADYYIMGTALAVSLAVIAHDLKKHHHKWWWVPQAAQIGLNAGFAAHNALLLTRR